MSHLNHVPFLKKQRRSVEEQLRHVRHFEAQLLDLRGLVQERGDAWVPVDEQLLALRPSDHQRAPKRLLDVADLVTGITIVNVISLRYLCSLIIMMKKYSRALHFAFSRHRSRQVRTVPRSSRFDCTFEQLLCLPAF